MSEEQKDIAEVFDYLKNLSRDDLMMTYGFALGRSTKSESEKADGKQAS